MAKFRMKPVEKEAFRWTVGPDQVEYPAWLQDAMGEGYVYFRNSGTAYVQMVILTPEGELFARPGDWIVKGIEGEIYPVKASVFDATYEPVTK